MLVVLPVEPVVLPVEPVVLPVEPDVLPMAPEVPRELLVPVAFAPPVAERDDDAEGVEPEVLPLLLVWA